MSCDLTSGFTVDCRGIAGISTLYIGLFNSNTKFIYEQLINPVSHGQIIGIENSPVFYEIELQSETGSFTQQDMVSVETNTSYFDKKIEFTMYALEQSIVEMVRILGSGNWCIIFLDNNQQFWLLEDKNICNVTSTSLSLGKATGDLNGVIITLETKGLKPASVISSGVFTPGDTYGPIAAKGVMITSFDEFGYDTDVVYATTPYGNGKSFNAIYEGIKLDLGASASNPDFSYMIQEDLGRLPTVTDTVMWINWFSENMYNPQTVRPYIQETTYLSISPDQWSSGGYGLTAVTIIPTDLKGGGSPNDESFLKGAQKMQSLGYKVGIIPVLSTADLTLDYHTYLNWRGYIFFDNETIFQKWVLEYEAFITYYIDLCYNNNIDLGYIYVGSEFQTLLTASPQDSVKYQEMKASDPSYNIPQYLSNAFRDQFISVLAVLGEYAKNRFPNSIVTYASNWTEYGWAGNQNFNLDSLWINPNIDRIGIDWYFPLTQVHTDNKTTLLAGETSGEYFTYYYTGYDPSQYDLNTSNGNGKLGLTAVTIDVSQGLKDVFGFLNNHHYCLPRYVADASPLLIDENTYNTIYDSNSISGITGSINVISTKPGLTAGVFPIGGSYGSLGVHDTWMSFTGSNAGAAVLPTISSTHSLTSMDFEVDFRVTGINTSFDRVTLIDNIIDVQLNLSDSSNPYVLFDIPGATGGSFFGFIGAISFNTDNNLKINITNEGGNNYSITTNINGNIAAADFVATSNLISNFIPTGTVVVAAYNIFGFATMFGRIYRYSLSIKSGGEYYGGVYNFEDSVYGVRNEWDYFYNFNTSKKIMATEIGAGSYNGSSVNPNVFVTSQYSNTAPETAIFPPGHNMADWFSTMASFQYFLQDLSGAYGSTFELDETHQKAVLDTQIRYLNSNGVTDQVIYTLDCRYSGSFGAIAFDEASGYYEVYGADTPIFPMTHAINGKYANGYTEGVLNVIAPNIDLTGFVPLTYPLAPTQSVSIGTAHRNFNSYVNPDLSDYEWTFSSPTGSNVCGASSATSSATINPGGTASGNSGRFIRFYAYGDVVNVLQRPPATISFEAIGNGTIDVIIYSTYDLSIQGRQQFTLGSTYSIYSYQPPRLYPNTEYILGIYVNGLLSSGNVTATFKKNFCLDMNTSLNLPTPYIKLRADYNTLVGNSQPLLDWYGYDDHNNVEVNKYHQSSAFSRLTFETTATYGVIEYVRDFYNILGINMFNLLAVLDGFIIQSDATIVGGNGAISNYMSVVPNTKYTFSGFLTTNQVIGWYDSNKNPIGNSIALDMTLTVTSPAGAAYLVTLVQSSVDDYTVYSLGQIQEGGSATDFENFEGLQYCDISGLAIYVNGSFYQYLTLEPQSTAKLIQQISFSLPGGSKTVDVYHNGRGAYAPFDPLVRRSGTFIRSVYLPDVTATINTSTKTGNIVFIGDSIISGFKIPTNPIKDVWVNQLRELGYPGDVFHHSYAGLILNTFIGTTASTTAFVNQLSLYPNVSNYFIQGGINDGGNNIPLASFTASYTDFVGKLHGMNPSAEIYCLGFTPAFFETNALGLTYGQYRQGIKVVADSHTYSTYVDFSGIYPATFSYIPDGIHPNALGTTTLVNGLINQTPLI